MRGAGIVYLVGAGPGDPELLTVRGLRCLQQADVLVYDRLVAPELLDEAPEEALRIDVGKEAGHHRCRQEEINALLVRHAQAGKVVVRLKGGDPFVFGRGAEEALACAAAGVDWEVVPGVTSATSVPARAGIPVTHRGLATSFAVVTGHCLGDDRVDWGALARIDTLLILMGLARLGEVTDRLLALGRPAEMPAAVVSQGTLPGERVVVTTLGGLAAAVARERPASPALVVVGEVVRLREELGSLYTRSIPARKRWAIRPTSSRETAASPTVIPHQRPAAPRCVR
ncbi:MAG TPA: uroporphyrinogen-III C-methyltransferase [Acidobacteria bacterium]|nr:uroporphyrinogen-III C-methyltransferase [Acidobacteriota bacterium]